MIAHSKSVNLLAKATSKTVAPKQRPQSAMARSHQQSAERLHHRRSDSGQSKKQFKRPSQVRGKDPSTDQIKELLLMQYQHQTSRAVVANPKAPKQSTVKPVKASHTIKETKSVEQKR